MVNCREWDAVTESLSLYERFLDEYQWAISHIERLGERRCPHCTSRSLRLIFIVDEDSSKNGTSVFWCASCLFGLVPLRAPVPGGAESFLRGAEVVPNYSLIIEE